MSTLQTLKEVMKKESPCHICIQCNELSKHEINVGILQCVGQKYKK